MTKHRPRREARMRAVQFLFQRDFNSGDLEEALQDFWHDRESEADMKAFTDDIIRGVESRLPELDGLIQGSADNWDVSRMGAVDRNVMRVAVYEMLYRDDVPAVVSINEAVELAKALSDERSGRFVNGILDRIRKDIASNKEPG